MINTYRIIKAYLLKRADEEHLLPKDQQLKALRDLNAEQSAPGGLLDSLNKRLFDVPHLDFADKFSRQVKNITAPLLPVLAQARTLEQVGDVLEKFKEMALNEGRENDERFQEYGRETAYAAIHREEGPQGYLRDPDTQGGVEDAESLMKIFFYHMCQTFPFIALILLHDNRFEGVLDTPTLHSFIDEAVDKLKQEYRLTLSPTQVPALEWITQLSHFFPEKVPMDYIDHPLEVPPDLTRNLVNNKRMNKGAVKRCIDNALNQKFDFATLKLAKDTDIYPQSQIDQIITSQLDQDFSIENIKYAIALGTYTPREASALIRTKAERRPKLLLDAAIHRLITKADAQALVDSLKGKIANWERLNEYIQEAQLR